MQFSIAFIGLIIFLLAVTFRVFSAEVSKIVAKVNSGVITSKDLDDYCKMLSLRLPGEEGLSTEEQSFRSQALTKLIEDRLILDYAKKEKFEVPSEWTEAKFNEISASFSSREDFEDSLIEKGLTISMLRERIKNQYLVRQVLDKYVRAYVGVSPNEINSFYDAHSEMFVTPKIYELWIALSPDKDILISLGKIIKEKGIDQAQKEYSSILTRFQTTKDGLREDIAQFIDQLREKEYTIKRIDEKNHLLYLEKITAPKQLSFEEAKERVQYVLKNIKFKERYQEWIKGLKEKAMIKTYN